MKGYQPEKRLKQRMPDLVKVRELQTWKGAGLCVGSVLLQRLQSLQ